MRLVFGITFLLTCATVVSQKFDQGVILKIELAGARHDPLNGVMLGDSGLFIGKMFYSERLFGRGLKIRYKHKFIPRHKLNKTAFANLMNFLILTDYLDDVAIEKDSLCTTTNPFVYQFFDSTGNQKNVIVDYDFCHFDFDDDNCSRHVLHELVYVLNQLIPDQYDDFRIGVGYKI